MNAIRSFTAAVLTAVLTAVLAVAAPADAQVVTLRVESPLPAMQPASLGMQIFKDEVERLSTGSIGVEVVPDSLRGSRKAMIDAVRSGSIFATWLSITSFSRLVPETAVLSVPFVFENYDQARRALITGPLGSLLAAKFQAKGLAVLTWMDGGAFNVSNAKRPLKTIDDFKGLKIRVIQDDVHQAAFRALGARPVPMDDNDVDAALRNGEVDGAEQRYTVMYAGQYFKTQKYLADTAHFLDFDVLVADGKAFGRLTPVQQRMVLEAAEIASLRQRRISAEAQSTALARLQDAGMQFDRLPVETRAALRRATAGVIDHVRTSVGADIIDSVLAANGLSPLHDTRR